MPIQLSPVAAAEGFADANGTASSEAVAYLRAQDIVQGYQDGTFRPDRKISRVEFLKIALQSGDISTAACDADISFPDVIAGEWFFNIVCAAVKAGIVNGYADGTFRPHDAINVAEASKIIARVEALDTREEGGDDWFTPYVRELREQRVFPGTIARDGDILSRGEMAQIVWGLQTGYEVENEKLGSLPQLESCYELTAQLEKYEKRSRNRIYGEGVLEAADRAVDFDAGGDGDGANEESFVAPTAGADAQSGEYSTTNVQEFGVDEADIIKNDGSHIFMIKGNTVRIIKAYPAQAMEQVATLMIDTGRFYPQELYLDDDTLTIIGYSGEGIGVYDEEIQARSISDIAPGYFPQGQVKLVSYNVSDRSNPEEIRSVSLEGNYLSSRKIGDTVYLVANKYNWYRWGQPLPAAGEMLPAFSDSSNTREKVAVPCDAIRYFPNFQDPNFLILAAINTVDTDKKVDREVLLGSGDQVYASQENLYVTRTAWDEVYFERGTDVGWNNAEFTEIYRFSLDNDSISFTAKGRAQGNVLNQFSMSEYDNVFRIATQKGQMWGATLSESVITTFDADMNELDRLEGIAPGERMYSARFVGDRAYMVTFKKVDPLFVIDVADPEDLEILGKLKIPGYSDYLHPYDEDHIIGFGKEAVPANEEDIGAQDFAWYQGMKIALFDVSDVQNPRELYTEVIGDRGTDSEILHNHKALLFDRAKELLAFPVTVHEIMDKDSRTKASEYGEPIFQGVYVYTLNLEEGFTLRGKLTNYDDSWFEKTGDYFYGSYDLNMQRVIYIGEYLYGIAQNMITAATLEDVEVLKSLELDQKSCSDLQTEYECRSRSECQSVFEKVEICKDYSDQPGECSVEEEIFLRCEER